MATAERELKQDRFNLRATPRQSAAIREAAQVSHKDVSAFVLDAAVSTAENVLADRRLFRLDANRWDRFLEILDRPVMMVEKPRLEKLLRQPSVLEG